jgi:uncharacterized protein
MPLLICPNCNVGMTQVNRTGIEIDMCPQCRGVWLDRGELEKLLEPYRSVGDTRQEAPPRSEQYRERDDDHGRHADDHHGRHSDDHGYGHQGRRRPSILDIFD